MVVSTLQVELEGSGASLLVIPSSSGSAVLSWALCLAGSVSPQCMSMCDHDHFLFPLWHSGHVEDTALCLLLLTIPAVGNVIPLHWRRSLSSAVEMSVLFSTSPRTFCPVPVCRHIAVLSASTSAKGAAVYLPTEVHAWLLVALFQLCGLRSSPVPNCLI